MYTTMTMSLMWWVHEVGAVLFADMVWRADAAQ